MKVRSPKLVVCSKKRGSIRASLIGLLACGPFLLYGLPTTDYGLAAPANEDPSVFSGRLLYSRLTDGTWQIWQTDVATDAQEQVTFSPGDKRYPAWGPEGGIVYQTSNQAVYVTRGQGGEPLPLLAELWPIRDAVWSPDGRRVAFAKIRTDLVDAANIWLAEADGSARTMLTHEPGLQYSPAWSRDGSRLAYVGGHGYGTYEIVVMNADGTDRRPLTQNHSHEFLPAWSPDGTQLAYTSDATGDYEIWLVHADGSHPIRLTDSPGLDTRPAWSPDGRSIAFTTNRTGKLEIWIMDADGSNQRPLEQAETGVCDPSWR